MCSHRFAVQPYGCSSEEWFIFIIRPNAACLLVVLPINQGWLALKRLFNVQAILLKLSSLMLYHFLLSLKKSHEADVLKSAQPGTEHSLYGQTLSSSILTLISLHTGVRQQTWPLKHITPAWSPLPFICTAEAPVALVERHRWCTCVTEQMSDLCSQTSMRKSSKINMCVLGLARDAFTHSHLWQSASGCLIFRLSLWWSHTQEHFPWLETHLSHSAFFFSFQPSKKLKKRPAKRAFQQTKDRIIPKEPNVWEKATHDGTCS